MHLPPTPPSRETQLQAAKQLTNGLVSSSAAGTKRSIAIHGCHDRPPLLLAWWPQVHYFSSHPKLNYYAVVPKGGEAWWEQPHDRAERFGAK